ncbi:hypothetical protein ABZY09_15385 [Streptomyces sp. NPDC002928]|uniref:hypothetical protein n=1 Tax=Streptomyces sp. NPDC002928 TaxID=3154440 RepID=UPI0033AB9724
MRFAHLEKVAAAGCYAEHVSQGSGQFLCQKSYVRARVLAVEGFRSLLEQFGCRPELHRFESGRRTSF